MAKDLYHDAVKTALMKEGWMIIDENYQLKPDPKLTFYVDVQAEKFVLAKKKTQVILVEVKSFISQSNTYELHSSIGQYLVYKTALEYLKFDKEIFLAVPISIYKSLFQRSFMQFLIEKYELKLLPFHPIKKEIIR